MVSNFRQINKVLVAGRGEIAVRIFRTLSEMGIGSVAIHASDDEDALHVAVADESFLLKGNGLSETYLNMEQIVDLAIRCGADAIHPGYGFLSENHEFAAAVENNGLIFIGPDAPSIKVMGNKTQARKLATELNIPVIEGIVGTPEELTKKAESLGFPIMVKAAAGGGGKGMRIVNKVEDLPEVLASTSREALNYFGNAEIYIERLLPSPRHIEIQLLADQHGKVLSLLERECSLQRRHQKFIEEAPAPNLSNDLKEKLTQAAITLARHMGYRSAGTVEFLVQDDSFYFLEMNTRIQVEHPVTEMITGIDIVREQLRIASGQPLPFQQEDIRAQGHAIEARVCAEDPSQDFLPSPGRVLLHQIPTGNGLRVDTSIANTGTIGSNYDPLVSKVISYAPGRETARKKLIQQLRDYALIGVKTNLNHLIHWLRSDSFIQGRVHTRLFSPDGAKVRNEKTPTTRQMMAVAYELANTKNNNEACSVWQQLGYWRIMPLVRLLVDEEEVDFHLRSLGAGTFYITAPQPLRIELLEKTHSHLRLEVGGVRHKLHYVRENGAVLFQHDGVTTKVCPLRHLTREALSKMNENPALEGESIVLSPMHGKVIEVKVKEGDRVDKGDTLLILESMKMENRITATAKATVKKVNVGPGEVVSDNLPLIHLFNELK